MLYICLILSPNPTLPLASHPHPIQITEQKIHARLANQENNSIMLTLYSQATNSIAVSTNLKEKEQKVKNNEPTNANVLLSSSLSIRPQNTTLMLSTTVSL